MMNCVEFLGTSWGLCRLEDSEKQSLWVLLTATIEPPHMLTRPASHLQRLRMHSGDSILALMFRTYVQTPRIS